MKGNDQWMSMAKNIGNPVGNFGLMFNDKRESFKINIPWSMSGRDLILAS